MNRNEINKEASLYWDYLVDTAMMTNTPISKMSDRSVKNKMIGKKYIPKDKAELYVSDVYAQFLEKTDEQVSKIVSGDGDIKHYLTKAVMISVMSPRSAPNYMRKSELNTVSYDNINEDFDFINNIVAPLDGSSINDFICSIIDEALLLVDEDSRDIYIQRYRFGVNLSAQYRCRVESSKDHNAYQTMWRKLKHTVRMVKIYMSSPEVSLRIEKQLRDE